MAKASVARANLRTKLSAWRAEHKRTFLNSWFRLWLKPFSTILTWLVIGVALALPVAFYIAIGNVHQLSGKFDGNAQVSLFLHQRASQQMVENLRNELAAWPELQQITVIGKDQALEEFRALSGFADVLSHLQQNPLPVVIEILPSAEWSTPDKAELLLQRLQKLPAVEQAQLDLEWVQRLNALLAVAQQAALGLVLLLSAGVLLIIGNTVRLEIENRRDEVIVTKLVGATDSFVRRPFLYAGAFFGLGGGVCASIIVFFGLWYLHQPVADLAGLYQSDYVLLGLSLTDILSLWLMAAMLGYFGAWLSVSQHLDELEP